MTRVVQVFAPKRLRDECIQPKKQPAAEDGQAVIEALPESRSTDSHCTVGQSSDHDRVDDTHAHPADLREDERQSKTQRYWDISTQTIEPCSLRFHET